MKTEEQSICQPEHCWELEKDKSVGTPLVSCDQELLLKNITVFFVGLIQKQNNKQKNSTVLDTKKCVYIQKD